MLRANLESHSGRVGIFT